MPRAAAELEASSLETVCSWRKTQGRGARQEATMNLLTMPMMTVIKLPVTATAVEGR